MPSEKSTTPEEIVNCRCGAVEEDGRPMVQCNKCAQWEHIACTFNSAEDATTSAFLCHSCKSDASSQCTPSVEHCSTQTEEIPPICNCKCALEVSQLKQEVLDMKVQIRNQLKLIHNAVLMLSQTPTLDPAVATTPSQKSPGPYTAKPTEPSSAAPSTNSTASIPPSNLPTSPVIDCLTSSASTTVKEKVLKRPRVRSIWGTRRSTTEQEVTQSIHKLGCKNLKIERRTSKVTSGKHQTWRFVVMGEEADINRLEENWKSLPERWELRHPDKHSSNPSQGCPFQEHLPRRPPIQTGMIHRYPVVRCIPTPFA